MMLRNKGFTLFECLVYLALVALVTMLLAQLGSDFFIAQRRLFQKTDTQISLYLAALHIMRDFQEAPVDAHLWKIEPDLLAWHGQEYHAWKLRDGKLLRTQGRETAAVMDGVELLEFRLLTQEDSVYGVSFSLRKGEQTMQRFVPLHARIYECF